MLFNLGLAVLAALTLAGHPASPPANDRILDARWSLNAAGQLQLWWEETYTVIINDRTPKMCGDPDGTGRHTWFFTDALMIEVVPVRSPATPMYPHTPLFKERTR